MKVKTLYSDGDTLYKVTEVSVAGKQLTTPIKSLELARLPSAIQLNPKVSGLNEIYRTVDVAQLKTYMGSSTGSAVFERSIKSSLQKAASRGDVSVLFLDCEFPEGSPPQLKATELEFLSDTAHAFSDIVTVPLVSGIHQRVESVDSPILPKYRKFVDSFVEEVEKLNHKPIMGTVPPLPWQITKDLCERYLAMGIRSFCFDFGGRPPSATEERNIRPFLKTLRAQKLEEKVLLYALNANPGKVAHKRSPGVISAKDIISFGFGFDILGQKHTRLKGPKEMYAAMASKGPQVRLFDKNIYGYRKADLRSVKTVMPSDSSVKADQFLTVSSFQSLQSAVNTEQQGLEAIRLRTIVKESEVTKYLAGKTALDPADYKKIAVARKEVEQKGLDRWF